jgi:hypothetical protein
MSNLEVDSECRDAHKEGVHFSDTGSMPSRDPLNTDGKLQHDQNFLADLMAEDEGLWVPDVDNDCEEGLAFTSLSESEKEVLWIAQKVCS